MKTKINPVFNKYKSIPAPIKASFWFLISSVFINGIRFFVTPILTRIMSEADYGTIGLFNAWQGAISVVVTLSLSAGVFSNGLLDYKEDKAGFATSVLALSSISAVIWYLVYVVFKNSIISITSLTNLQITIMFLGFLVNPALGYWSAEQKFDYKYKLLSFITICTAVVSQLISIILVLKMPGNKANLVIVSSSLVNIIVNSIIYVYILSRGKFSIKLEYWKYVLKFNLPLIPHYLSFIVLAQSDRILIANIIGMDKAGIYTLGYTIASVLQIIYGAINASLSPFTLKKMKEKGYEEISNISDFILVIYAIISIVFIALSPEIIKIMAPPSYYEAIWVIPPVVIGLYFFVVTGFFTNIEFYHKKTIFIMISTTGAAIANILLNLLLIPIFGFIAAAYTTAVAYFLFMIFHYFFMRNIEPNKIYNINFFIKISILFIAMSIFLILLFDTLLIRIVLIIFIFIAMFIKRKKIREKAAEISFNKN